MQKTKQKKRKCSLLPSLSVETHWWIYDGRYSERRTHSRNKRWNRQGVFLYFVLADRHFDSNGLEKRGRMTEAQDEDGGEKKQLHVQSLLGEL